MGDHSKVRISVLISGEGTNLQALIEAQKDLLQHCTIVRVTSSRKAAYGLTRAKEAGIPTSYRNLPEYEKRFPDDTKLARSKYNLDLAIALLQDKPDIICCAGWMLILGREFLDHISSANVPVINLHPALPGAYNRTTKAIGEAHQDWLKGEISKTGVMIHYVIFKVDEGEPILVQEIPFVKGVDEDIEKFEEKVHEVEHKAIVEGTKMAIEKLGRGAAGAAS